MEEIRKKYAQEIESLIKDMYNLLLDLPKPGERYTKNHEKVWDSLHFKLGAINFAFYMYKRETRPWYKNIIDAFLGD